MTSKKKGGIALTWTPLPVNDYNDDPALNSRSRVLLVSPEVGKILSSDEVITPEQFKILSKTFKLEEFVHEASQSGKRSNR